MNKHLLAAIIMALCLIPTTLFAQDEDLTPAYDFSAVNDDGVTIFYNIISEEEKTCEVTEGYKLSYADPYNVSVYSGNLVIPESANGYKVIGIGKFSLAATKKITSVTFPNTLEYVGSNAFFECNGISSITLPNSLKSIGDDAFCRCENLSDINMSNSPERFGTSVFYYTPWLEEYENNTDNIYGNILYINDVAYKAVSTDVKNVQFKENTVSIAGEAFRDCTNLTTIDIPKTITTIADMTFYKCINLTSIVLPNSITSIGHNAFCGCKNLAAVILPSSLTSIGSWAFDGCTKLTSAISYISDVFVTGVNVFRDIAEATLYVPHGLAETYRANSSWGSFTNIVEMPGDTPEISFSLSCNTKGTVSINGMPSTSSKIVTADINEGSDNTFTFTPKKDCKLEQVVLNGLDITANVENNTLTATIPANSQMIVTFSAQSGDLNNDGRIDITDVVAIVNKILGI